MQLDSDRCHFCGNWTKDYKEIGDKSICQDCLDDLMALVKEELGS